MAHAPQTLSDFITRRRSEIAETRARLRAELAALEMESEQIERAAKAAGIEERILAPVGYDDHRVKFYRDRHRPAAGTTIREAVVQILQHSGRGMTAVEILPAVNAYLGQEYPRTSLSPQLSRLKHDGIIESVGSAWSLVSPSQKQKPSSDPPEEGSKPEDGEASILSIFE